MPYIGEIRMFAGNFAPLGWLFCDGQALDIADDEPLFHLIGTMYGGDGERTFALPDLRGRLPVHQGDALAVADAGGTEDHALVADELPAHAHGLVAARVTGGAGNVLGGPHGGMKPSVDGDPSAIVARVAAHPNLQPSLCINFVICLSGTSPATS